MAQINLTIRMGGPITPTESEAFGLAWREHYLVLCQAEDGSWMSLVTPDVEYGRFASEALASLSASGATGRVDLDLSRFPITLNDGTAVRALLDSRRAKEAP